MHWRDRLAILLGFRTEAYVRAAIAEVTSSTYQQGHEAGAQVGFQNGYQIGRAHGEHEGREAQLNELLAEFGFDTRNTYDADAAQRIRSRLKH